MKIILGSQSKGRRQVMKDMGYQFETMNPNIDERAIRFADPEKLTLALAHAKADALLSKITEPAILVTSDQVVVCNRKILEKPENEQKAREFFHGYATHPLETVVAVVATNTETKKRRDGVDIAKILFRPIPESVINSIVTDDDVFSLAGGVSIEDPRLKDFIEKVDGTIDSVIGLPKKLTERLIREVES